MFVALLLFVIVAEELKLDDRDADELREAVALLLIDGVGLGETVAVREVLADTDEQNEAESLRDGDGDLESLKELDIVSDGLVVVVLLVERLAVGVGGGVTVALRLGDPLVLTEDVVVELVLPVGV